MVGGAAAAVSGGLVAVSGAVGLAIGRNLIGTGYAGAQETNAYIEDSEVIASGDIGIGANASETIEADEVRLDVGRNDPVDQILDESHISLTNAGVSLTPIVTRYAWPSELDLMARIAGLQLRERWAGWNNEPFTSTSARHVSVYGNPRL